ncbi:MAG: Ig-like domain-containing protein [Acidobacteria bacterium]|nr:Ig-like domain-containing protein [Acidobacteriota bacterium]
MFTGRKLPLTLAFVVLVALAIGASCKGFFVDPTLTGITISPTSPQVEVGKTQQLSVFGTYDDGTRKQVKSGVNWSTVPTGIVTIDPSTSVMSGDAVGTTQLTADAQGLNATATATAFLGDISGLTVCTGTFNTGTCPAATWSVKTTVGGSQDYYAKGTSNSQPVDVTTVATWLVTPTPTAGAINCDATSSPAVCTIDQNTTTGSYVLTVTYPKLTPVTANIDVTPGP